MPVALAAGGAEGCVSAAGVADGFGVADGAAVGVGSGVCVDDGPVSVISGGVVGMSDGVAAGVAVAAAVGDGSVVAEAEVSVACPQAPSSSTTAASMAISLKCFINSLSFVSPEKGCHRKHVLT